MLLITRMITDRIGLIIEVVVVAVAVAVAVVWLIGNRTSCRPIQSVVLNESDSRYVVNYSYDYRPNWTHHSSGSGSGSGSGSSSISSSSRHSTGYMRVGVTGLL